VRAVHVTPSGEVAHLLIATATNLVPDQQIALAVEVPKTAEPMSIPDQFSPID
jgi:hypothetical protein